MRRALVLFLILVAATSAALATGASGQDPGPAGAPTGDRDGDKLFDDLEASLAEGSAEERLSVIVTLEGPASAARVERLGDAVGGFRAVRRFSIIPAFAATMSKRQVLALARRPEVAHVEENRTVRALNDTAQASFGVTKARADASVDGNADGNADTSTTSSGAYSKGDMVAAVLDTGIDADHDDLDEGKVIAFANCTLPTCPEVTPHDDEGHGTHVAATLAGDGDARADRRFQGVAPGAALVGVKVLNAAGVGTVADVIAGLEWVVDHRAAYGIEAVNLSLGDEGCSDGSEADSQAVNAAFGAGLVVAVAAGNDGPGTCTIGAPAAATGALTVGAMADMGTPGEEPKGFYQAFFSSCGPTADGRIKPDVSAPGVNITSANGNPATKALDPYQEADGTSMASPFVAGVSLLMLDAAPTLGSDQVKAKIVQTAVDWGRGGDNVRAGSSGPDIDYGAGRLDAYAAVASAGAAIASPPAVPAHALREGSLAGTDDRDDYPLDVTDTSFPIAATLIVPSIHEAGEGPDFDLQLFAPNGTRVARSERGTFFAAGRQEELGYRPTVAGTYTLRVNSFEGAGAYFVDVSAGIAGAGSSGGGGTSPGTGDGGSSTATGGGSSGSPPAARSAPAADTRAARVRLALSPRGNRVLRQKAIVVRFRADERVRARFSAAIAVPGASRTFRLRAVTRRAEAGKRITVRLRVSRKARRAIGRALRARRRVSATVAIRAVDAAGNRSTARRRFRLRR